MGDFAKLESPGSGHLVGAGQHAAQADAVEDLGEGIQRFGMLGSRCGASAFGQ